MAIEFKELTLITDDIARLRVFYETVFDVEGDGGDSHVVFELPGGSLVLWRSENMEEAVPGAMADSGTGRLMMNFEVDDVDAYFDRVKDLDVMWLLRPTTHAWGRRAMWFRDPDGNGLSFYQVLK